MTPASSPAQTEAGSLKNVVTIVSAFLALLSALSSLMVTRTLNRSVGFKSEEAIMQSKVADQWAYYQSKNIRLEILEALRILNPNKKIEAHDGKVIEEIKAQRDSIANQARQLETQRENLARTSRDLSELGQNFTAAVALLQLALMLMPLVYIRDSRTFLNLAIICGSGGSLFFFYGLLKFIL